MKDGLVYSDSGEPEPVTVHTRDTAPRISAQNTRETSPGHAVPEMQGETRSNLQRINQLGLQLGERYFQIKKIFLEMKEAGDEGAAWQTVRELIADIDLSEEKKKLLLRIIDEKGLVDQEEISIIPLLSAMNLEDTKHFVTRLHETLNILKVQLAVSFHMAETSSQIKAKGLDSEWGEVTTDVAGLGDINWEGKSSKVGDNAPAAKSGVVNVPQKYIKRGSRQPTAGDSAAMLKSPSTLNETPAARPRKTAKADTIFALVSAGKISQKAMQVLGIEFPSGILTAAIVNEIKEAIENLNITSEKLLYMFADEKLDIETVVELAKAWNLTFTRERLSILSIEQRFLMKEKLLKTVPVLD